MKLRDFAVLGILVMVLFQLITSAASIYLLTRMSPAIERILSENVTSITAAEKMLVTLSVLEPRNEKRKIIGDALVNARKNTFSTKGRALLDAVENDVEAALAGDTAAKSRIALALEDLSSLNRAAMRHTDEVAKRIGNQGAWAMALLGIVGFFAGVLVIRRIVRGVIAPVEEIRSVLEAQLSGESARRVYLRNVAPDISELGALVNQYLSKRGVEQSVFRTNDALRAALLHFMDAASQPVLLASSSGETIAANSAMEILMRSEQKKDVENILSSVGEENASAVSGWNITSLKEVAFLVYKELPR